MVTEVSSYKDFVEELNHPNLCPKCLADWDTLQVMLKGDVPDDKTMACCLILSCPVCKEHFTKEAAHA